MQDPRAFFSDTPPRPAKKPFWPARYNAGLNTRNWIITRPAARNLHLAPRAGSFLALEYATMTTWYAQTDDTWEACGWNDIPDGSGNAGWPAEYDTADAQGHVITLTDKDVHPDHHQPTNWLTFFNGELRAPYGYTFGPGGAWWQMMLCNAVLHLASNCTINNGAYIAQLGAAYTAVHVDQDVTLRLAGDIGCAITGTGNVEVFPSYPAVADTIHVLTADVDRRAAQLAADQAAAAAAAAYILQGQTLLGTEGTYEPQEIPEVVTIPDDLKPAYQRARAELIRGMHCPGHDDGSRMRSVWYWATVMTACIQDGQVDTATGSSSS
jgi:hypothetical protein